MLMCCVSGCESRYSGGAPRLYQLPQGLLGEHRKKLWERNLARSLPPKALVCEKHFTSDQFNIKDGKKTLKWNAIPTIFAMKRPHRISKGNYSTFQISPAPSLPVATPITFVNRGEPIAPQEQPIPQDQVQQVKLVQQIMIPLDMKDLSEIKKETPPGCIPILPKYKPSQYVSVRKTEIEEYQKDIKKYKFLSEACSNKITLLKSSVKEMKKEKKNNSTNLKDVFNEDQIQCLHSSKEDVDKINWGYKTIDKAVELYAACGEEGYKVILSHNLPYPSLELLKKLKPEIFDIVI